MPVPELLKHLTQHLKEKFTQKKRKKKEKKDETLISVSSLIMFFQTSML